MSGVIDTICFWRSDAPEAEHLRCKGCRRSIIQALMRRGAVRCLDRMEGHTRPVGELLPFAMAVWSVTSYAAARAFFLYTADLRAGITCLLCTAIAAASVRSGRNSRAASFTASNAGSL